MQKGDSVRLRHMLDAAREVASFAQDKNRRSLDDVVYHSKYRRNRFP
jgi:uncharacterized protein with HEPN domain